MCHLDGLPDGGLVPGPFFDDPEPPLSPRPGPPLAPDPLPAPPWLGPFMRSISMVPNNIGTEQVIPYTVRPPGLLPGFGGFAGISGSGLPSFGFGLPIIVLSDAHHTGWFSGQTWNVKELLHTVFLTPPSGFKHW